MQISDSFLVLNNRSPSHHVVITLVKIFYCMCGHKVRWTTIGDQGGTLCPSGLLCKKSRPNPLLLLLQYFCLELK